MTRPSVSHGDPEVAESNEILRTLVGSSALGVSLDGMDDVDLMGVFIEPPAYVFGLRKPYPTHTRRTKPEGERSGPGDTDLTIYSLRHYIHLCADGNPTAITPLFAPPEHVVKTTALGEQLRLLAPAFASRRAGRRFLGYLHGQRERLTGEGKHQARMPNRPELVEAHGFDTKYAYQALRLGMQGEQMLRTGRVTLPVPWPERETLLALRRGQIPFAEVLTRIDQQERVLQHLLSLPPGDWESPLPDAPDEARIEGWSIEAHLAHWREAR